MVLLILAGISLNLVLGNNGIVTKANLAVVKQENATVAEAMQFKVNYYNMESIEDIKTALQADRIIDADGQVDTYTLLEQKLKTGNGSNKKDVYVIENGHLYYYEKNEEKTDLGDLWNLKTANEEETDPDLFVVDDEGTLWLKVSGLYYSSNGSTAEKNWTIENLVIPKTVDGKEVKRILFASPIQTSFNKRISGWENLKTVVIPEGVTSIGSEAFMNCTNLTGIVIPDSITYIESEAFSGCSSLANFKIPNSVIGIGVDAFKGTPYYENMPDGDVYLGKVYYEHRGTMQGDTINIKEGTVGIGDKAFYNYSGLKDITLPSTIKNIGNSTFSGCSGLASINLPNAVINIGWEAFSGCGGLTGITIPDSVTSIGLGAFSGCTGLTNIIIPNSVTGIEGDTFSGCTGLTTMTIQKNIKYIDSSAFSHCSNLKNITILGDIPGIEWGTFSGCSSLTTIALPESVVYIGDSAFEDCSKLANVIFPDSLSTICENAFYNCHSLLNIVIPKNVAEINIGAFAACTNLTNIMVDESNTIYDSRDNCNAIIEKAKNELIVGCQNTIIPNSITSIGTRAFWKCTQLTKMIVPESVTNIDWLAFEDCIGLTNITIPENVTSMRGDVFYGWTSNQTINCEAAAKPDGWDSSWNYGCNAQIKWNAK